MSGRGAAAALPVSDEELIGALGDSLRGDRPVGAEVVRLDRRPSEYRTSFALEEVDAVLGDGSVLRLVLKDLRPGALHGDARRAKPAFLYDPGREVSVYRSVLAEESLGTARLYGSASDPVRESFWLLLERVPGVELYQVGELETWREAARWLARLHARLPAPSPRLAALAGAGGLIRHDAAFYRTWIGRAREFQGARDGTGLDRLAERYGSVVERLLALPTSLIHGEFYASNLLVQERPGRSPRVCPVDWEMAALGPGLVDLAALVAGRWSEAERAAIVQAYREEWALVAPAPFPEESLRLGLAVCRLHLAVQWLGWSADWSPPPEHAHDWLGEALDLAGKLAL